MQIYNFRSETGDYVGAGIADESPLETGVFLIPANATKIQPPVFDALTHTCRFYNGAWNVAAIPEPEPEPADPVPDPRIAELKSELAALDIKRIRPTAEGDTAYLATLNAQAVALRAELQALL